MFVGGGDVGFDTAKKVVDEGKLRPVAKAAYSRSFFGDKAGDINVVLDEDIRMAQVSAWDGVGFNSISFPYDVLTVTGTAASELPQWIVDINGSAQLFQVTGFSKAAHAVSHYHAAAADLPLPQWHSHLASAEEDFQEEKVAGDDIAKPEELAGTALEREPPSDAVSRCYASPAAHLLHQFGAPQEIVPDDFPDDMPTAASGGGLDAPLLARNDQSKPGVMENLSAPSQEGKAVRTAIVTVQPKTLYAIERTLLEWIHFAVLVAMVGLVSLHQASSNGALNIARAIVLLAIFIIVWALRTFTWRADALDNKLIQDYHDSVGPMALGVALLASLVFSSLHAAGILELGGAHAPGVFF
jgi:uncharacterized membrane protein YidH (DUF202 family)